VRLARLTTWFTVLVLVDLFGTLEVLSLALVHRHTYAEPGDTALFWLVYLTVILVYVFVIRYTVRIGRRLRTGFAGRASGEGRID
jgi:hypothetical protein